MAEAGNEERRALRKRLRQLGWNVGSVQETDDGVTLEVWPRPHTGPGEGVTPIRIVSADKTAALREAVTVVSQRSAPQGSIGS